MNSEEAIISLQKKGIKATTNRILILKALVHEQRPMSISDIEEALITVDKSSIFRVLSLFMQHDVVHSFEDGRGILNYELCHHKGVCNHHDSHIHFYCEKCQKSFCMEDINIPSFELPQGYRPHSVSFVIKGTCPYCAE